MVKKRAARAVKIPIFVRNFGRWLVLTLLVLLLTTVVGLVLISQIETTFDSENIMFVPAKKSGTENTITLVSIDKATQKLFVYQFDGELKSEVIGGYGEYPLASVWPLLQLEKKSPIFIQSAFAHLFKHFVSSIYEYQPTSKITTQTQLIKLLLSQRQTWPLALQIYKSGVVNLSFNEINNWEDWNKMLKEQKYSQLSGDCSVAVVNATKADGLANQFSEILENSGVEVVRTTNSIWDEPKTALYHAENLSDDCQEVTAMVQAVSPVTLIPTIDAAKPTQYRAKIVLFIGEELAEILK